MAQNILGNMVFIQKAKVEAGGCYSSVVFFKELLKEEEEAMTESKMIEVSQL